jgi:formylglycine-generating enzyme required for sulfatase activity/tRNA A-37 threonylcarbamoyl transferase component Bud32
MDRDTWIGKQLGSYQILSLIGKGGAGRVYKARHTILGREAAIKVLRADLGTDDTHHERFLTEARTIAQMRHPHIVQLYDFGVFEDTYYMVMEHIRGDSLEVRLKAARAKGQLLPGVEVWRIIKQMGEGLTYTHERGVIHRDIKPANVLMTRDGNVVISDFGVAKLLAGHGDTTTGAITGTPAYMAPEQALGEAIDHRADLYAMAVIVYEMLAGRLPFEANSPLKLLLKHVNEPVPPPRQFNPAIPPHVDAELLKALSKRPEDRHQSVVEFLHALASPGSPMRGDSARALAGQVTTVIGPDGKEYIHIPAGEFWMGSPHASDTPRRKVYLDGFYISRYPVTNAEYHAFVEATHYMPPEHWRDGVYADWEADQPVVYVSWHDAAAYCRWAGGRLPTAAEWEKAARGTDGRRYPWGNTFDPNRCNTRESGRYTPSSVGKFFPAGDSPYGVGDMAGNVWEWTLDWYAPNYDDSSPARNPMGPETGRTKVIRGGSFSNNASLVTCYTRDHALPDVCAVNYGFRVWLGEEVFKLNTSTMR